MLNIFMVVTFSVLSMVNYRSKRDILSPSFILSIVWVIYISLYSLFKNMFNEISFATYGIYLIGAFLFSAGELFGEVFINKKLLSRKSKVEIKKFGTSKKESLILTVVLLILLSALPVYYKNIVSLSGASLSDMKSFFWEVRRASLDLAASSTGTFSIINNLAPLSLIMSVYFYNIYKKTKQRQIPTYLIIVIGVIYQMLTGAAAGGVFLLLSLIGVDIMNEGRINKKNVLFFGSLLFFVLTFIAYYVGKGAVDKTLPFTQNIGTIFDNIIIYLLGGMVAFNDAVIYPGSIASNGGIARFFLLTAKSLGFNIVVPSQNFQYSIIGPGVVTNVYTMYSYYYLDYGLIGTCLFVFMLGIVSYLIYMRAKDGSKLFSILYGYLVAGLILSVYSESFYSNLNLVIKTIVVVQSIEFIKRARGYKSGFRRRGREVYESSSLYRGYKSSEL